MDPQGLVPGWGMRHSDAVVDQNLLVGWDVSEGCDGANKAETGMIQPKTT